jgi:hypothetical protein
MRHGRRVAIAGMALVVAGAVGLGGSPVSAATDSGWTLEPIIGGDADVALNGVAALTDRELIAVGWRRDRATTDPRQLVDVRRRAANGTWTREPVRGYGQLRGAAAASPRDAWVVGVAPADVGTDTPLVYRYAAGVWTQVKPGPLPAGGGFNAVAAVAPNDVWAVGEQRGKAGRDPMIQHWDGVSWKAVDVKAAPEAEVLYGVTAISAKDVWAVGARRDGAAGSRPFAVHWDGTRWTEVAVPAPPAVTNDTSLRAVAGAFPNDVWAVGAGNLIEHWDGRAWKVYRQVTPAAPGPTSILTGISARHAADIWAVGFSSIGVAGYPVVKHWDGNVWSPVEGPRPVGAIAALNGVAAPKGNLTFVVGTQTGSGRTDGLAAHR